MGYIFKEKITFKQYEDFLKKNKFVSFMQEDVWARSKNIENRLIVAILDNKEVIATAQIIIEKISGGTRLYVPNGYLLDFSNQVLLTFMTENIYLLAKKHKAYVVDIYPYLTKQDKKREFIHNNLLSLNYQYKDEYIDNADYLLIPLKKKIASNNYDEDFYRKRGIFFKTSNNIEDIRTFLELNTEEYIDNDLLGALFINFKDRIKFIFAKLDLVFYVHYLKENNGSNQEINKIEELILAIGDEIDIGCSLIILPHNKNDVADYIYNIEKESFDNLNINQGMLHEAQIIATNNRCKYLRISNLNLNINYYLNEYNATKIEYIGHYYLVINKIKYFFNKDIRKK